MAAKSAILLPLLLLLSLSIADASESESKRNPYYLQSESFRDAVQNGGGRYRLSPKFQERSEQLLQISNYRMAVLEINPRNALLPAHCDAHSILYVEQGKATVTLFLKGQDSSNAINQEVERESYNLRKGDVLPVPAGTPMYILNNGEEKLRVVKLLDAISVRGELQPFLGIGQDKSQSIVTSFDKDIIQAAFKSRYASVKRLFLDKSNKRWPFTSVSESQIKEIARKAASSSSSSKGSSESELEPMNIYKSKSSYSNNHGQLYELTPENYPPLREQNIAISLSNIAKGSMSSPLYYSEGVKIGYVLDGNGKLQIVHPDVSHKEDNSGEEDEHKEEEYDVSYENTNSELSVGDAFVILPGHPFVIMNEKDENLQILCFETRARNNDRYELTGPESIWRSMNEVEQKIFFDEPKGHVDRVLKSQENKYFISGPRQHNENKLEGHADE